MRRSTRPTPEETSTGTCRCVPAVDARPTPEDATTGTCRCVPAVDARPTPEDATTRAICVPRHVPGHVPGPARGRRTALAGAFLALATIVASCSGAADPPTPPSTHLVVFAAASLTRVLQAADPAFESSHPGVTLTVSPGASSALRVQIEQGAPADVFLSADTVNAEALVSDGLASGPAIPFAGNELTMIVPVANPAHLTSPADLARPGIRIVAAGPQVPITKYAGQVVGRLAEQPGYGPDFAARYAANVVSHEDDVSAVVAKVALGEGNAAIVYETDARSSSQVRAIPIPAAANVPATYAGVVVASSAHVADARTFLDWLAGPGGQAILAQFGFLAP
jgi:molybdate transport system substrate-binding protein